MNGGGWELQNRKFRRRMAWAGIFQNRIYNPLMGLAGMFKNNGRQVSMAFAVGVGKLKEFRGYLMGRGLEIGKRMQNHCENKVYGTSLGFGGGKLSWKHSS